MTNQRIDYNNDSPDKIQNAKNNFNKYFQTDNVATDKFLAIEHDIHEQTAHNLTEYMLKIIQDKGYRGVTVGECLGDPAENWYRASSGKIVTSSSSIATATSSVVPTSTPSKVSTDATCGGTTGLTCQGSEFGNCCSAAGWCGSTDVYCGAGCNPLFGTCAGGSDVPDAVSTSAAVVAPISVTTVATSVRATSTSKAAPAPAKTSAASNVSTNGKCGARNGNKVCPGTKCCSVLGNCGSNLLYCWAGCQKAFGKCF
jgi:hypothetical protein